MLFQREREGRGMEGRGGERERIRELIEERGMIEDR
jgi:hypothetical protein